MGVTPPPGFTVRPTTTPSSKPVQPAVSPGLLVGTLWLLTRGVTFLGLLAARHGDVGAALGIAATNIYDASWYRAIALHGYADPHLGGPVTVFYPGYPLAVAALFWPVKVVSQWLSDNAGANFADAVLLPAAMLLISNLALVGALIVLWRLYQPRLGTAATVLGIGLLLAAPTSLFLSIGYSESLFILLVAGAFLLAQKGRWISVGIVGAAACLIRFPGAFLFFPLVIIWLQGLRPRPTGPALIGTGIFAIGALAYPTWLWATSGDALAYLHLQQTHNRSLVGPIRAIGSMLGQARDAARALLGRPSSQRLVDVPTIAANSLAFVAGIVTIIAGWSKLRAHEILWVGLVFLVPLLSGTGESLDRYWLAAFPFFFLMSAWLRRWPVVAVGLMAVSTVWLFLLSYNFARLIWVG